VSDQLSAAARALRLSRVGTSAAAHATEERVLARAASQSRRTRRVHWLLPIAAVLAVSSGWAATQPGVQRDARAWWQRLTAPAPLPAKPRARLATPGATVTTVAALAASAAPSAEGADARVAPPPTIDQPAPSNTRLLGKPEASAPLRQPAVAPAPEPTPAQPTSLQLYQRAHELHFRKHDFAAALAAWDGYLASAAAGPFALEARYNRGICLTRLGRTAEARSALLPFARGDYGDYRQAEANALLNGSSTLEP